MAASSDYRLGSLWLVNFDPSVGTDFGSIFRALRVPLKLTLSSDGIAIAYSLECHIFLYSIMGNQDILPRFTTVIEHIV